MKICGIICEYNPFHNGHAYLIERAKAESGCDAVVCVMSGNFTQRGEAAVLEKHARARHAVLAGADAVVELPAAFAVSPAELFARGGVRLLAAVPAFDCLAFGCERGGAEDFWRAARVCAGEGEAFRAALRERLDKGLSFTRARSEALAACGHEKEAELLRSPNNILGAEYARALLAERPEARILPVRRKGAGYADAALRAQFSSATAIRAALAAGRADELGGNLPAFVLDDLRRAPDTAAFYTLAVCALLARPAEELQGILDCTEGLENRLRALAEQTADYEQIVQGATGKRYIASRIRRILAAAALGIGEKLVRESLAGELYLNVLAVRRGNAALLAALGQARFPALLRAGDERALSAAAARCLAKDRLAEDVYAAITHIPAETRRTLFI